MKEAVMRTIPQAFILGLWLSVAACANLPPEPPEQPKTLQWEAATECERRFSGIRVMDIDHLGRMHYEWGDTADQQQFVACYQERVREKIKAVISPGRLPPSARASAKTVVPIQVVENKVLAAVTLNESQPATLILDTGAAHTIISPTLLQGARVSLATNAARWRIGLLGREAIAMPFARMQSVRVGAFAVEDLDVGVYDVFPDVPWVHGLLGADFLNYFRVTVDHSARRLTLEVIQR
jgi:hypothetical protein